MSIFPKIKMALCGGWVLLFTTNLFAGKADSVLVFSKAMQRHIACTIVTPNPQQGHSAPMAVMYLLHGYSGNHRSWLNQMPELTQMADEFQTIIVCPDGGYNSWYFDSPLQPSSQYATFVAVELPAYIDAHYATLQQPLGRAISGLSMGGHGAFYLAMLHPEVFGTATSMSGGLDLLAATGKYEIAEKIGPSTGWQAYSVLALLDSTNGRNLRMLIDCGSSDFFIAGNRNLHQKLLTQKVPHAYLERPGAHTWDYWKKALPYHLLFFRQQWLSITR